MTVTRQKHKRHGRFPRIRHGRKIKAWLARIVTAIGGTGTSDDFVATADVQAAETLTLTGQPLNNEIVTIGDRVYKFQTVLTNEDGNVLIGAAATDSLDNLIAAIVLGAGFGTLYADRMTINKDVIAAAGAGDTMDVTAKLFGTASNSIVTTEGLTNGSWGGATLSGGIDGKLTAASHGITESEGPYHLSSTTTLPAGLLAASTDYWVNVIDANDFTLSRERGGPKEVITDTGTGTHSLVKGGVDHDMHELLKTNHYETIQATSDIDTLV